MWHLAMSDKLHIIQRGSYINNLMLRNVSYFVACQKHFHHHKFNKIR